MIAAFALAVGSTLALSSSAVAAEPGLIFSVAGGPSHRIGALATEMPIKFPSAVGAHPDGGFLVTEPDKPRVWRVFASGGVARVAGTGDAGYSGDGGSALEAELDFPTDIDVLPDGSYVVVDFGNRVIRRVSANGRIETVAGSVHNCDNSVRLGTGDGGPATDAALCRPAGVSALPDGGFLFADSGDNVVRRVAADGTLSTVAGNFDRGFSPDGPNARSRSLFGPVDVAALPGGAFLVAEQGNSLIRRVSAAGALSTVAGRQRTPGVGREGFSGDGGPATKAKIQFPSGLVLDGRGGFYIADEGNARIRHVGAKGLIRTVAGNDLGAGANFAGDGGLATKAHLSATLRVDVPADGTLLIADGANHRARMVTSADTQLLALAVCRPPRACRSRAGTRPSIGIVASRRARAVIKVFRGQRLIALRKAQVRAGSQRLALRTKLAPSRYSIEVRLERGKQRAIQRARLINKAP